MDNLLKTLAEGTPPANSGSTGTIHQISGAGNDLESSIMGIINAALAVLGVVCVIIIVFGGVQYMTSTGEAAKVKKAKDTILYGVIGLIICALAAVITNFVIANIIGGGSKPESSTPTTPQSSYIEETIAPNLISLK